MRNSFLILLLLVFTTFTSYAQPKGRIRLIFRYDDYTFAPSRLNDTLLSIFKRNKIPLTIGVIPFDEKGILIDQFDKSRFDDLRARIQNNEIEVALHGFNHQNIVNNNRFKRKYYSEFATSDYSVQYNKIRKGKNAIDSLLHINIETFIPPFDTYDSKTLDALEDLGFRTISASIFGSTSAFAGNKNLKYMPATTRDFFELPSLLKRYKDDEGTIVVYFHPYSFRRESLGYTDEYGPSDKITTQHLDSLLTWVKKQDIDFYTFSSLEKIDNFDKSVYVANYYKNNLIKTVLYKFKKYRYGIYSTPGYLKEHGGFRIWNFLFHIGVFILVFFAVSRLIRMFRPRITVMVAIISIMILSGLGLSYYLSEDSSLVMKLILLVIVVLATILGMFWGMKSFEIFKKKSKTQVRQVQMN